jgi:hypothetical protein
MKLPIDILDIWIYNNHKIRKINNMGDKNMNNCYSSNSPATNSDFSRFMQSSPDLTGIIDWIKDNIDLEEIVNRFEIDPEDIFHDDELETWANKNGHYEYIDQFPQVKIDEWAKENGYIKVEKDENL